jgi:integrase
LSADEEQQLLQVAPPLLRSMIITALDTGMRQGEMLALRFGVIDARRQLIVRRPKRRKVARNLRLGIRDDFSNLVRECSMKLRYRVQPFSGGLGGRCVGR